MMIDMTSRRSKYLPVVLLSLVMLGSTASSARADDEVALDARLEGYATKVDIGGSTALNWLLLAFLSAVALGVLFKDAKRSHLD